MKTTIDHLLERVRVIDDMMSALTQRGLNKAQDELSAIEAELDTYQPEGEFVTLLGDNGQPVGFEPIEYGKVELAHDELNQVHEWTDNGFSAGSFL
jgi:hypothetical protein